MSKKVTVRQVVVSKHGGLTAVCQVVNEGPLSPLGGTATFEISVDAEGGYGPNEAGLVAEIRPLTDDLLRAVRQLALAVIKDVS